MPYICPLADFPAGFQCGDGWEMHHIINRSKARGNKALLTAVSVPELMVLICKRHNFCRLADTKQARKILLLHQVKLYGLERMQDVVNGIPWKVIPHELTWDGIMAGA